MPIRRNDKSLKYALATAVGVNNPNIGKKTKGSSAVRDISWIFFSSFV